MFEPYFSSAYFCLYVGSVIPTLFSCVFELVGEKETRGTLTFLLGLDKNDLLVYTQIIKAMHICIYVSSWLNFLPVKWEL